MKPLLLLLALAAFAQAPRVRIFVGESETWEASGFSAGAASASRTSAFANAFGGAHSGTIKLTVAMMKEISERCPNVVIVNKPDSADYFVRVDHTQGFWARHDDMAVFNKAGEMVFAASSAKVSKDAKRFCQSPVFGGAAKHKKEDW